MKAFFSLLVVLLGSMSSISSAQQLAPKKTPLGVPADATLFNGKWYRVYLEKTTWVKARDKCRTLGGQLVSIPDAPTQAFLAEFGKGVELWIGATDEKVEGLWVWVDGTEMKYKAWGSKQPDGRRAQNYAALGNWAGRGWFDGPNDWPCVGFICEWKDK